MYWFCFTKGVEDVVHSLRHGFQLLREKGIALGSIKELNEEATYDYFCEVVKKCKIEDKRLIILWGVRRGVEGFNAGDVILLYASKINEKRRGYILEGKVICVFEEKGKEPYWPSEENKAETDYPYRFLVEVTYIHPSVLTSPDDPEKWKDPVMFPYAMPWPRSSLTRMEERQYWFIHNALVNEAGWVYVPGVIAKLSLPEMLKDKADFVIADNDKSVTDRLSTIFKDHVRAVLLEGPPGSGKTVIARLVSESLGYKLLEVTCHEHLTRFDVIGGYTLSGGSLKWQPGIFVKALAACKRERGVVLLLDEINRARVERILGELFGALGTRDYKVPTSLLDELRDAENNCVEGSRDIIKDALEVLERNRWCLPGNLKIIATMNTADAAALFRVGFALRRRFKTIRVLWSEDTIRKLLETKSSELKIDQALMNLLKEMVEAVLDVSGGAEVLQPGILINLVHSAVEYYEAMNNAVEAVAGASRDELVPHLLRLPYEELERLKGGLKTQELQSLVEDALKQAEVAG